MPAASSPRSTRKSIGRNNHMRNEYQIVLKRNGHVILVDTKEIDDASIMSTTNADEFEKKVRDYVRALNK